MSVCIDDSNAAYRVFPASYSSIRENMNTVMVNAMFIHPPILGMDVISGVAMDSAIAARNTIDISFNALIIDGLFSGLNPGMRFSRVLDAISTSLMRSSMILRAMKNSMTVIITVIAVMNVNPSCGMSLSIDCMFMFRKLRASIMRAITPIFASILSILPSTSLLNLR